MSPDSGRERISRLGVHTFATRAAVYALGFVVSVLVARALGPEGRGRYVLPVTIVWVTTVVATLGTHQALYRLWGTRSATPDSFVTANALLSLGSSAVATGAVWLLFLTVGEVIFQGLRASDLAIAMITLPFFIHQNRTVTFLAINGQARSVNLARVVGAAAQTTGVLLLFVAGALAVQWLLFLYVASFVAPWLLMLRKTRRIGRLTRPVPRRLMSELLRLGLYLGPTAVLMFLTLRLDIFFIAHFEGDEGVGIYTVAVTFAEVVWLVTDALAFSIAERQANAPEPEAADVTLRAVRMSLVLAGAIGVAIGLGSPVVIPALYGEAFSPAVGVIWVLLPAAAFMATSRAMAPFLIRSAKPWIQPLIATVSLIVNVIANLVLIPALGMVGAGIASTISYAMGAVLGAGYLVRSRHLRARFLIPGAGEVRSLRNLFEIFGLGRAEALRATDDLITRPQ